MTKVAAYTGTRDVYDAMEASAKSLVANSSVDRVHFFIEDAEFPRPLPDIVECHDAGGQLFFEWDGPNIGHRYTYMALMRAALPFLLYEVDVALSLDCDTVCVGDCDGLWDISLDGCYFAAVREKWAAQRPGLDYCNVGVSLMNLKTLRDAGKAKEIVGVLNRHRFAWPEQDAMNYLCQGRVAEMPPEYNVTPWTVDAGCEPRIVHYAAMPGWDEDPNVKAYAGKTWDEVMALRWAR